MAAAKKHGRRKKRASSSSTPTSPSIRSVRSSSAPTTADLARRLGITASSVRRRARAGTLSAVRDSRGRYHFPGSAPSTPRKKPPFRKKRGKAASRETPRGPAPRKKKPRASPEPGVVPSRTPRPSTPRPSTRQPSREPRFVRRVVESSSPSLAEASRLFGVSSLRLLDWVRRGLVRAVLDAQGTFHVPAAALQARQLELRARRKKTGQRPAKKASKRPTGKKLVRRKKKRVRKTKPSRQRFTEAIIEDTRPSRFAPDVPERAIPTRDAPMPMETAGERLGNAMRDFVMAKPRWERLETGRVFHDLKSSFKNAYGERAWRETYAWVVDEYGLEDYIIDYEALRDSRTLAVPTWVIAPIASAPHAYRRHMDALHWTLFGAIGLLTVSFLSLTYSHRELQRRMANVESSASSSAEESRRAHVRLDNQQRQLEALARELGWADDRSHTKVLTERLALPLPPRDDGSRGP